MPAGENAPNDPSVPEVITLGDSDEEIMIIHARIPPKKKRNKKKNKAQTSISPKVKIDEDVDDASGCVEYAAQKQPVMHDKSEPVEEKHEPVVPLSAIIPSTNLPTMETPQLDGTPTAVLLKPKKRVASISAVSGPQKKTKLQTQSTARKPKTLNNQSKIKSKVDPVHHSNTPTTSEAVVDKGSEKQSTSAESGQGELRKSNLIEKKIEMTKEGEKEKKQQGMIDTQKPIKSSYQIKAANSFKRMMLATVSPKPTAEEAMAVRDATERREEELKETKTIESVLPSISPLTQKEDISTPSVDVQKETAKFSNVLREKETMQSKIMTEETVHTSKIEENNRREADGKVVNGEIEKKKEIEKTGEISEKKETTVSFQSTSTVEREKGLRSSIGASRVAQTTVHVSSESTVSRKADESKEREDPGAEMASTTKNEQTDHRQSNKYTDIHGNIIVDGTRGVSRMGSTVVPPSIDPRLSNPSLSSGIGSEMEVAPSIPIRFPGKKRRFTMERKTTETTSTPIPLVPPTHPPSLQTSNHDIKLKAVESSFKEPRIFIRNVHKKHHDFESLETYFGKFSGFCNIAIFSTPESPTATGFIKFRSTADLKEPLEKGKLKVEMGAWHTINGHDVFVTAFENAYKGKVMLMLTDKANEEEEKRKAVKKQEKDEEERRERKKKEKEEEERRERKKKEERDRERRRREEKERYRERSPYRRRSRSRSRDRDRERRRSKDRRRSRSNERRRDRSRSYERKRRDRSKEIMNEILEKRTFLSRQEIATSKADKQVQKETPVAVPMILTPKKIDKNKSMDKPINGNEPFISQKNIQMLMNKLNKIPDNSRDSEMETPPLPTVHQSLMSVDLGVLPPPPPPPTQTYPFPYPGQMPVPTPSYFAPSDPLDNTWRVSQQSDFLFNYDQYVNYYPPR